MGGFWSEEKKYDPDVLDGARGQWNEFTLVERPYIFPHNSNLDPNMFNVTRNKDRSCNLVNYGVIPDLIITKIALFFPLEDLPKFFSTCKLFYHCSNSNHFWKLYYRHIFFSSNEQQQQLKKNNNKNNWKEMFYFRFNRYSDNYYRKKYDGSMSHMSWQKAGEENKKETLKVIFLGCSNVGKTSLVYRIQRDVFQDYFNSLMGVSWPKKYFICSETKTAFEMNLWDTAGQERFRSLSRMYVRGSDIVFLCFSIDDRESFEDEESSFRIYQKMIEETLTGEKRPVVLLLGMKNDLEDKRRVTREEAILYVKENKERIHGYVENSSKTGKNVMLTVGIALDLFMKKKLQMSQKK